MVLGFLLLANHQIAQAEGTQTDIKTSSEALKPVDAGNLCA